MKYIIIKTEGLEVPIIFSEILNHSTVAHSIGGHNGVISAGYLYLSEDGQLSAHGYSSTLGINSRSEDVEIIKRSLSYY